MIEYKELEYDEEAILTLYECNGWTAYTSKKAFLLNGIQNSLDTIGAYQNGVLIGLIRIIGDKYTIIYIQDILILPNFQNQGIGTKLINQIVDKYSHVRQIVLMTDESKEQINFYEKNGFVKMVNQKVTGFVYKKGL